MSKQSETVNSGAWHFPRETVAFLKDLKANNDRGWFAKHKAGYDEAVKQPAQAFCSLMVDELSQLSGEAYDSKVFRVHRDVRFSKDKTPYNTHLHISFFPALKQGATPAWFFGLDPERLALGAGIFGFDKRMLETYRQRVAGSGGKDLAQLLGRLERDGVRVSEPELKRIPPGYDKGHEYGENLRRKSLSVWLDQEDPNVATQAGIAKSCAASFARLKPVMDWLQSL